MNTPNDKQYDYTVDPKTNESTPEEPVQQNGRGQNLGRRGSNLGERGRNLKKRGNNL